MSDAFQEAASGDGVPTAADLTEALNDWYLEVSDLIENGRIPPLAQRHDATIRRDRATIADSVEKLQALLGRHQSALSFGAPFRPLGAYWPDPKAADE